MKRLSLFGIAFGLSMTFGGTTWADGHGLEITGDVKAGEKVFRKCKACHQIGDGAKSGVGPILNGILGRQAASYEEFKYSDALTEKAAEEELVWTPEALDAFLLKPRDYAKGTKMSFAGLRKEDDRANIIAYLATFTE